jgi:hypothetical protein
MHNQQQQQHQQHQHPHNTTAVLDDSLLFIRRVAHVYMHTSAPARVVRVFGRTSRMHVQRTTTTHQHTHNTRQHTAITTTHSHTHKLFTRCDADSRDSVCQLTTRSQIMSHSNRRQPTTYTHIMPDRIHRIGGRPHSQDREVHSALAERSETSPSGPTLPGVSAQGAPFGLGRATALYFFWSAQPK